MYNALNEDLMFQEMNDRREAMRAARVPIRGRTRPGRVSRRWWHLFGEPEARRAR